MVLSLGAIGSADPTLGETKVQPAITIADAFSAEALAPAAEAPVADSIAVDEGVGTGDTLQAPSQEALAPEVTPVLSDFSIVSDLACGGSLCPIDDPRAGSTPLDGPVVAIEDCLVLCPGPEWQAHLDDADLGHETELHFDDSGIPIPCVNDDCPIGPIPCLVEPCVPDVEVHLDECLNNPCKSPLDGAEIVLDDGTIPCVHTPCDGPPAQVGLEEGDPIPCVETACGGPLVQSNLEEGHLVPVPCIDTTCLAPCVETTCQVPDVPGFPHLPECGLSLLDLLAADWILVTDGALPPVTPPTAFVTWTVSQYLCTSGELGGELDIQEPALPTSMSADELVEMEKDLASGEWASPEFIPCNVDCIDLSDAFSNGSGYGLSSPYKGPRTTRDGDIYVYVIPPVYGDPQYPSNWCNMKAVNRAMSDMTRDLQVPFHAVCAVKPPFKPGGWNTTESWGEGPDGVSSDTGVLLERFQNYVRAEQPWAIGLDENGEVLATNHVAATFVAVANHIGEADGFEVLVAEKRENPPQGHARHSVFQHEMSHLFGALHHPDNSWKKNVCRIAHWHGSSWHTHEYRSVMNYCHMYWGVSTYDQANYVRIRENLLSG